MKFSANMERLEESGTIGFFARVLELRQAGRDIVSLTVGELDCHTPDKTKQAGIEAIRNNETRYTFNHGTLKLRQAIVQSLKTQLNLDYSPDQILVSNGSKQAALNLLFALTGSGDEVIIFSPYYPSFPQMIKICGATPVVVPLSVSDNYQIDADALKRAITPRTRIVIVNSPNNPTGAVYTRESLEAVDSIAAERDLYIISDEIYSGIVFPPAEHLSPATIRPDSQSRALVVNGCSKAFAMTGWRIGYCAGPTEIIKAAALFQSHVTNNACSISQAAAATALTEDGEFVKNTAIMLESNRNIAIKCLSDIDGIKLSLPDGAFYLLLDIGKLLNRAGPNGLHNSFDLTIRLLEDFGVAVVPGSAFGAEKTIRLSFACSAEAVREGCLRLNKGLKQLV